MTGYRIQIPPTTELHQREIELRLRMMRDFYGGAEIREVWFHSTDEVIAYLNDVCGVRTERLRRVTPYTLRRWRQRACFPYYRSPRGQARIVTSNLMIMAWLWSFRIYQLTAPGRRPDLRELTYATAHLRS